MATKTLSENVTQAIADFGTIKQAIIAKGVSVPAGTPTSQYGTKISQISGGDDGSFKGVIERTAVNPTLPSNLTSIGAYAFYQNTSLVLPSLPDGITSIGDYAFQSCTNLALTSLPSNLTSIGAYAFVNCPRLSLNSLPNGITSIGRNAFERCSIISLTRIPSSLTSIETDTFTYCFGLKELTFEGTPNTLHSRAFYGCSYLTTINVPWAEGEVANAPWGATNATIVYNYSREG